MGYNQQYDIGTVVSHTFLLSTRFGTIPDDECLWEVAVTAMISWAGALHMVPLRELYQFCLEGVYNRNIRNGL